MSFMRLPYFHKSCSHVWGFSRGAEAYVLCKKGGKHPGEEITLNKHIHTYRQFEIVSTTQWLVSGLSKETTPD